MGTQVDASTISAGMLFSTNRFHVPDFQREYSWKVDDQVREFWEDIKSGLSSPPYFLGLIIVTDGDPLTVIDGQQRLVTLTLVANALRIVAEEQNAHLVATSMQDMFLTAPNYEAGKREPRVNLTSHEDRQTLEEILEADPETDLSGLPSKKMTDAHAYLLSKLREYASENLGKWARYLTSNVQFAQFLHPTPNAAFKVFEIVNTRGQELTPAELIKSYLIGNVPEDERKSVYDRWRTIESTLRDTPHVTITHFVRHAETLRSGYVIPRDLYERITKKYTETTTVAQLLDYLEFMLPLYVRVSDPWSDATDEDFTSRALTTFDTLGITTVRPLFLALLERKALRESYEMVMRVVVTRVTVGQFGTGTIERQFAEAAQSVHDGDLKQLEELRKIKPDKDEFVRRVREGNHNKGTLHVLRASIKQSDVLPDIGGAIHLIRPRYTAWPNFSDEEFRTVGNTIGNTFLSQADRRPQGTNTVRSVIERLLPTRTRCEDLSFRNEDGWPADQVRTQNATLARIAGDLYYE